MKQRWSCYSQSTSGILLGVEPNYLLYSKVLAYWTPVQNGVAMPPVKYSLQGVSNAPEAKNRCKIAL